MNLCKNCSAPVTEKFCGRCGEKVYSSADKSVKYLLEEAFHFLTHFEGKFFTTLRAMLTRPGKVSVDFCDGVRKKYFRPLSFYLLLIIAYLLFPMFEGLNMKLQYYYSSDYFGNYAKEKSEEVRIKHGWTEEEMKDAFHHKGEKVSKFMLFIVLPFMGLFSYAVAFWKRKFYFDHFIFATESASFLILFGFLILPLIIMIFGVFGLHSLFTEDVIGIIIYGGVALYTSAAARRFFNLHWALSLLYGLVFGATLLIALQFPYKFILFNVIILLL